VTLCQTCRQHISRNMSGTWLDRNLSAICDHASGLHQPEQMSVAAARADSGDLLDELVVPEGTAMFVIAVRAGGTYKMVGSTVEGAITHPDAVAILRYVADQWEQEHRARVIAQSN
jgi:hypothetical protein